MFMNIDIREEGYGSALARALRKKWSGCGVRWVWELRRGPGTRWVKGASRRPFAINCTFNVLHTSWDGGEWTAVYAGRLAPVWLAGVGNVLAGNRIGTAGFRIGFLKEDEDAGNDMSTPSKYWSIEGWLDSNNGSQEVWSFWRFTTGRVLARHRALIFFSVPVPTQRRTVRRFYHRLMWELVHWIRRPGVCRSIRLRCSQRLAPMAYENVVHVVAENGSWSDAERRSTALN